MSKGKLTRLVVAMGLAGTIGYGGAANAFGGFSIPDIVPNLGLGGGQNTDSGGNDASATADGCIAAGQGGEAGLLGKLKQVAVDKAVEVVLKEALNVEGTFVIAQKITDTCMADRYLEHAGKSADRMAKVGMESVGLLVDSIKDTKEHKKLGAMRKSARQPLTDVGADATASEMFSAMNDSLDVVNDQVAESGYGIFDQKQLGTFVVNEGEAMVRYAELASLYKHIGEFAKNNPVWAIKNLGELKQAASVMMAIGNQVRVLPTFVQAASAQFSGADKKYFKKIAKEASSSKNKNRIVNPDGIFDEGSA